MYQYLSKPFLKSIKRHGINLVDIVEIFHQLSQTEDLFCGTSPHTETSLFLSDDLFRLVFEPVQ